MIGEYNGFFMEAEDGEKIFVYCWENVNVKEPKGVLQIFHGMNEHAGRYKNFAKYLNDNGIIVYADDHRGHGRTAGGKEKFGDIGADGFNKIVKDEYCLSQLIKKKHPDLPHIIFGHSFGSFIAQEYIIEHGDKIDGLILSGSAVKTGIQIHLAKVLAYLQMKFLGKRKRSKLLNKLSFSGNNRKITDSSSKAAWLSRDKEAVREFEQDPLCKGAFTIDSYYYFFSGLCRLYIKGRLGKIPKKLPILICSGDADPVGEYGKKVVKLYEIYRNIGIKDVKLKIYSGARHEVINEINRKEVYDDIFMWNCEHILGKVSDFSKS